MTDHATPGSFGSWALLIKNLAWCPTTAQRQKLLLAWLSSAGTKDRMRAIRWLNGDHPPRLMQKKAMLTLHAERSTLPEWLRETCSTQVPDASEYIALLEETCDRKLSSIGLDQICHEIEAAKKKSADDRQQWINNWWNELDAESLFLFNRLINGNPPEPMPREAWLPVLSSLSGLPQAQISLRLAHRKWFEPNHGALFGDLGDDHYLPFNFPERNELILTSGIQPSWTIYLDLPGEEVQLVKRKGDIAIWDRSYRPMQDQFPELVTSALQLPDATVLFGRIMSSGTAPETRTMQVLDIWEWGGTVPDRTLAHERLLLLKDHHSLRDDPHFGIAEPILEPAMEGLMATHRRCRLHGATGLLIMVNGQDKHPVPSLYHWPAEPFRIKAVLLYAQRGDGVQGPQYSFALARGKEWITVARTGEGLDDADREELEKFIKFNTLQRFGPVRTVKATQVMELSVDSVRASTRHKSGYLLEGVKIQAWRKDLGTEMADDWRILESFTNEPHPGL